MSQVLLGVIGVVMFVLLALAGANLFGPQVTISVNKGRAALVQEELATVSTAVQVRDQERGGVTPSSIDIAFLAPEYVPEIPSNPTGGPAPVLLDTAGNVSGPAAFVAIALAGETAEQVCSSINERGGGPALVPTSGTAVLSQPLGCFRTNRTLTAAIPASSLVAFSVIG